MKFCDLAKTLHKYRLNRSETVDVCVLVLTDAILDDVALDRVGEVSKEVNPLYGLSKASLQSIYNGNRQISVEAAARGARMIYSEFKYSGDFVMALLNKDTTI